MIGIRIRMDSEYYAGESVYSILTSKVILHWESTRNKFFFHFNNQAHFYRDFNKPAVLSPDFKS